MEEKTEVKGALTDAELDYNSMIYEKVGEFGISTGAAHIKNYADQRDYAGGREIYARLNTGESFLDCKRSFISFTVNPLQADLTTPVVDAKFGSGSAHNVIQEIIVLHQSGEELARVREAGLYNNTRAYVEKSKDWFDTVGPSQGFSSDMSADGQLIAVNDLGKRFSLPLGDVCEFFDTDVLLSPQTVSGMQLRIQTAGVGSVFSAGTLLAGYTLTNFEIHLRLIDVMDFYRRQVAEMASEGLYYYYKEQWADKTTLTTTQYNIRVDRTTEKALYAWACPRITTNLNTVGVDTMSFEKFNFASAVARVGTFRIPQREITASSVTDTNEFYMYTMDSLGYLKRNHMNPNIKLSYANHNYGSSTDQKSKAFWAVSLIRNDNLSSDGMALNNARSLNLDITFQASAVRSIDIFLVHRRNCVITLTNALTSD